MIIRNLKLAGGGAWETLAASNTFLQTFAANGGDNDFTTFVTLPARYLTTANKIVVYAMVNTILGGGATTQQLRLKLGGTTVHEPGPSAILNGRTALITWELFAMDAPTAAARIIAANTGAVPGNTNNNLVVPVAVDTTIALALNVSVNFNNVDAANTVTMFGFNVLSLT